MQNVVGRTLLPWQQNFGKFGLFLQKVAHKSACTADRPEMFGPTRGGATLVAIAMNFGLGRRGDPDA